jgi:hypothetical protein
LPRAQDAATPLNGLSPQRRNPRCGFEIMKMAGGGACFCSGSTQMAPSIGPALTLIAQAPPVFDRSIAHEVCPKRAPHAEKARQNA